jgi:hypothetical protein
MDNIGAGYRELHWDEIIQPGDEYFNHCKLWVKSARVGAKAGDENDFYTYRRKIDAEEAPRKQKGRPPLGLKPKEIWQAERDAEVLAAIRRYAEADLPIPAEWLREYLDKVGPIIPA